MPPSSHAEFPRYPRRQRWNLVAARSSSGKDMVVQVGPDGHSSPGIICSPSLGVEKRPIPHVPAFCGYPSQVQWIAPATSQVFHKLQPSRSPTSVALLLGVWVRAPSHPPLLNSWLTPGGSR